MRAIRRCGAGFDVTEFDLVETVISHIHRFRAVSYQRAQEVPGILAAIGILQRRVWQDQILHAFPDERAYPARTAIPLENARHPSNGRVGARAILQCPRHVDCQQRQRRQNAHAGPTDPQPAPAFPFNDHVKPDTAKGQHAQPRADVDCNPEWQQQPQTTQRADNAQRSRSQAQPAQQIALPGRRLRISQDRLPLQQNEEQIGEKQ